MSERSTENGYIARARGYVTDWRLHRLSAVEALTRVDQALAAAQEDAALTVPPGATTGGDQ